MPPKNAAKTPPAQRAARPKAKPKPRPQSAAVPRRSGGAARRPPGRARQLPPLTADLVEHFGGQDRVDLIVSECVPPDATAGDVLRLLLEARRLRADPLRHDVYLARGSSRDGAGVEYSVAARRDALLAFAERQDDFEGFEAEAVYKGDTFGRAEPIADGDTLRKRAGVTHTTVGVPEDAERPVAAWCIVARRNRPPVVFVARAAEYMAAADFDALDPDDPRKRYPDRWLVKVAMCWPLRMAFGLNDVVGAEELTKRPDPLPDLGERAAPAIFKEGPVDDLDARILDAYTQAQALDALLWPPAKVSARLASARAKAAETGGDPATFDALRDELAAEIEVAVAAETARRRDPHANRRRLAELRAFDASTLDEDDLRGYRTELAAVEAMVQADEASAATA